MNRLALAGAIVLGFFLDRILGDPQWMWHPVRLLGSLIAFLEKRLYPRDKMAVSPGRQMARGAVLTVLVCAVTATSSWLFLWGAGKISSAASFLLSTVLCYFLFAAKSLETESMKVYEALKEDDLSKARRAVSMIVGRDTDRLDSFGVAKAAVETVAENTSDGVIAPLFYMAVGGPVLGWLYKAVNTMDSMVGYKNDRYLYFGRPAAKLDDLVNLIPSRISAGLMILAAFFLGFDWKNAVRIFRRDRFCHASPNSAQTEAVCAGALNVMLAGDAWYFGKRYEKKTIGDDLRPVEPEDIKRANRLLRWTAALAVLGAAAVLFLMWLAK